jgi:ribonuclease HI
MPSRLKIYFDGGCRPTPGVMEIALVVRGQQFVLRDQGFGTSTDAEWLALIEACRISLSFEKQPLIILGDCAPVIDQANGKAKARGSSRAHLDVFQQLVGDNPPQIRHVKLSQNRAGIALQILHPR